jgi:hypothetical protein
VCGTAGIHRIYNDPLLHFVKTFHGCMTAYFNTGEDIGSLEDQDAENSQVVNVAIERHADECHDSVLKNHNKLLED